jgi:1-acyl-sn-glycerol-3-phosphate acyltransferase
VEIVHKIEQFEREGRFDVDAEDDPPTKPLLPDDIDYLNKSFIKRIKKRIAFACAYKFFDNGEKSGEIVLDKDIEGLEHLSSLEGGAIITANHFNPLDSFFIQYAFDASKKSGELYRVIREGNYTSFPGFYGFLMRNCNTLPLSSSLATMRKFINAVGVTLSRGDCVLIYPEQSLWWNYKKPKPHKIGSYEFAVKSNVPVIPIFITMEDTAAIGEDGFPIQKHKIHIGAPIYPDTELDKRARAEKMRDESFSFSKSVYEKVYGIPLTYTTE